MLSRDTHSERWTNSQQGIVHKLTEMNGDPHRLNVIWAAD